MSSASIVRAGLPRRRLQGISLNVLPHLIGLPRRNNGLFLLVEDGLEVAGVFEPVVGEPEEVDVLTRGKIWGWVYNSHVGFGYAPLKQ